MSQNPLTVEVARNNIKIGEHFSFRLMRTLRIPADGKEYPLPPTMGEFSVKRVADYEDKVPARWREVGGVFVCLHQREAMWINFGGEYTVPVAVLIAGGKVCAITGQPWSGILTKHPQNYCVVGGPNSQPWLDGFKTEDGTVKQFVAMPLGEGYTVEKQITGEESVGGLQIQIFECKPEKRPKERQRRSRGGQGIFLAASPASFGLESKFIDEGAEMGLAAGGEIRQEIYPDDQFGVEAFDKSQTGRVFVHICNSQMWSEITGEPAPESPISAQQYTNYGFPWFDIYNETPGLKAQSALKQIKDIAEIDKEKGEGNQQDKSVNVPIDQVITYGESTAVPNTEVEDTNW